jgi:UDP-N-acetylmuramyl pentapeptide phosphotransferase/UDP-N-acetylglucosamine-1-phosphate transferase
MILARGLLAFAVSLAVAPIVLACARRFGVLDVPSHRSSHDRPTPRAGGIAPAVAVVVALVATSAASGDARLALLVGAGTFGVLGLAEDVVGVPALPRLALQVVAAGACLPWLLTGLDGSVAWRLLFTAAVVVWLVGYVNAFNFMDGIDGISVAQVVVAGTAWYLIGRSENVVPLAAAGAIGAGAALGFAPFNVFRARIFLGDVGSYFFGAWLAIAAVMGLRAGLAPEAVLAPLAVYAADTGVTLLRRLIAGETWYEPHRDHTYQRLVRAGWSHVQTTALVAVVIAVCAALGAVSLRGSAPARAVADAALAAVLVAYVVAPLLLAGRRSQAAPAAPAAP